MRFAVSVSSIVVTKYTNMKSIILFLFLSFTLYPVFGQRLSIQQQCADFDTLCSKLEYIHPDLFLHQTKEKYDARKIQTRTSFTDSASISDYYLKVAPFMASIKDGHSMMLPPITEELIAHAKNDGKTIPLRIKATGNVFVVDYPVTNETQICKGDTILSINGVHSKDILNRMYSLFASEKGNAIKEYTVSSYLTPLLWHMYQWSESYIFSVKRGNKVWEEKLNGTPQSKALRVIKVKQSNIKPANFTYLLSCDHSKATITIPNVYQELELKQFCDSVFKDINDKKIPELFIDVCNNTGGSSRCVERLISYFPHPDYTLYSKSQIMVSSYSKAYNKERHKEIYDQICNLPDGSLYVIKDTSIKGNKTETNLYRGKITILVNDKTYSGASTFAHKMQELGIAKIEGETGCPNVYFGNFLPFTLPNSKIEYFITFAKFFE